jgi:hypothetical protein
VNALKSVGANRPWLTIVDVQYWLGDANLSTDKLHPNSSGHLILKNNFNTLLNGGRTPGNQSGRLGWSASPTEAIEAGETFQEYEARLKLGGSGWHDSNGRQTYTDAAGDYYHFYINGSSVKLSFPGGGVLLQASVDGAPVGTFTQTGPDDQNFYTLPAQTPGRHLVRVERVNPNDSSPFWFDYATVIA